ncbi:xanthine dehydrogenase accessory protein XdhC [Mesorhizobium sp. M7A.F.Ca.US.008.03.1.1]|uniref:xanthine dehydrogenase accessory protein XdhC n=1 Tax=Mesorhizobium sp. M7A.F.Ca.US.008.03.1.1 TaxID=2496742 RepID=UPI000FCB08E1|nr:xanthine dehydrogenase accessory protein XdhC [Mesorhizobium sp. M7A.F.Ca.US.008.03.1.1]RUW60421.1 xanthine dehydrogenase accessory protein XdhC [Mesorhizobium sp. M7A.F.Ca.US.008.03.1.1]
MNSNVQSLKAFLASAGRVALVEVAGTKGSTPREKGAFMLVSQAAIFGTIGGGQLEYMAIDKARQMVGEEARIEVGEICATLDVPLGPEIGQCCGGRVEVLIRLVDATLAAELVAAAEAEEAHLPHVYIFGGGHVGQALASTIALLPVHGIVIETRAEALEGMPETVETRLTPMPEAEVRNAPAGTAFAILTHDHALDFLIVAEALKRGDTAYVGMIGSKTKKATFRSWFLKSADGSEAEFARLVSPIGGDTVKDKRPQVIAALAAAEIMTALVARAAASNADHHALHDKVLAG